MTREEFDIFCGRLIATTNVIQWGNASVWKVGGKIFAICSRWGQGEGPKFSFKCSDLAFEILPQMPDIIPAPYLARAKWVQLEKPEALSAGEFKKHIIAAHEIITAKLTEKLQKELGLK
ncbi:MAG: MmcQ/YjbR family DNA-binding protein [Rhodobacteraceae bacterium]|nr:MmcQ/YjbR family DNA-binding protein [Paracoccaceae bacterium]